MVIGVNYEQVLLQLFVLRLDDKESSLRLIYL